MSRRRAFGGAREREKEEGGHGLGLPSDAAGAVGKCRTDRRGERNEMRRREISISHPAKKSPIMVSLYSRHHRHLMIESVDA